MNFEETVLESLARIEARLTPKKRVSKAKEYSADFNEFWKIYPNTRKGNKDKAYAAYLRAVKRGNTEAQLLKAAQEYAKSKDVARGFAKGCEAWLNADGFNNIYEVANASELGKAKETGMEGF